MVVWKCDSRQPTTPPHGSGIFPESTKQPNGEAVMTKPIKTSNGKCRIHVQNRDLFKANNIFSEHRNTYFNREPVYIVYSYGHHYPMFVYHGLSRTWFENSDRYSVSTSKHRSQAHPLCPTHKISTQHMRDLISHGFMESLIMTLGLSQTEEAA